MGNLKQQGLRKSILLTVCLSNGTKIRRKYKAAAHQGITKIGIEQILEQESAAVSQAFKDRDFRLVPLSDGNFNLVEIEVAAQA